MFRKILFPTDFSKFAIDVFKNIPKLKNMGVGEIILMHVIDIAKILGIGNDFDFCSWIKCEERKKLGNLSRLAELLQKHGFNAKYTLSVGDPATEIVNIATKENTSVILIGCRGKSITKDILIGSVCEGVIRKSKTSVLVVKNPKKLSNLFSKIVYAHDLSRYSNEIFECVKRVALQNESEVIILHVLENNMYQSAVKSKINYIKNQLENLGIDADVIIAYGVPHREIPKISEEQKASVIVVGSRGLDDSLPIGTVTDSVIRYSKIPVLMYKFLI